MTFKPGVYKIFGRFPGKNTESQLHFVGRIAFDDTSSIVLEDHRGYLGGQFPDGPVDIVKKRRWHQMVNSPYLEVVADSPLEKHPDPEPESVYELYDEQGHRHHMVVYPSDQVWMDGRKIENEELDSIYDMIRNNTYHLVHK